MIAKKQIKMIKNAILCDLACYLYALLLYKNSDCNPFLGLQSLLLVFMRD